MPHAISPQPDPDVSLAQQLLAMTLGVAHTQMLCVAAQLGLADRVKDGPQSVAALAEATGTHPPTLARLMSVLVHLGLFAETASGQFTCTPLGVLLQTDALHSVRHDAMLMGGEWFAHTWTSLLQSVRTGSSAFETVAGMNVYQYFQQHPAAGAVLQQAMSDLSTQEGLAVREAYDFSPYHMIVDVGGGRGGLLATLLQTFPALQRVLFDVPAVIESAHALLQTDAFRERCQLVGGDFLVAVPAGGDLYLLKRILIDRTDDEARTLLTNIRDLQKLRAWFMLRRLWTHSEQQEADMKFGLFQSVQLPEPGAQVKYYKEALEQVLWAEQLGFDSVWFTEHHFSRHGIVPASMTVLAYLAGLTTTIRLATAVAVLPFHNPIQLAEEAATVDLLSNGRLDLGVGRGYQWGEFHKFNISMDEATRRFEEAMEVMTKAWTATEPFDHRGEFWSFNDMTLHPKPVQTPHPPIWVAASNVVSMDRVARHNWNLLIGQGESFQQVAAQVEYFRTALGKAGFPYSPQRVTAARAMYTARSQEQARRDTEAPFMWFKRTGQEVGSPPDHRVELLPEDFKEYRRRFARGVYANYDAMWENVAIFGTPEVVAERIEGLRQSGIENLIFFINYGGIENRKVLDSLELFATKVMPLFKE